MGGWWKIVQSKIQEMKVCMTVMQHHNGIADFILAYIKGLQPPISSFQLTIRS